MLIAVEKSSDEQKIIENPDEYLKYVICFADLPRYARKFSAESALYILFDRIINMEGLTEAIDVINSSARIANVKLLKTSTSKEKDFQHSITYYEALVKITTVGLIPSAKIITERVVGMILRLFDRDVGNGSLGKHVHSFGDIVELSEKLGGNHNLGNNVDLQEKDLLQIFNPHVMNRVFCGKNLVKRTAYNAATGFKPNRHIWSSYIYKAIRKYIQENEDKETDMFKATVNNTNYEFHFAHDNYKSVNGEQKITTVRAFYSENPVLINKNIPAVATAICHPHDQFVKAHGRKIALTRLLKLMNFSKEERTLVWAEYFKTHKKA